MQKYSELYKSELSYYEKDFARVLSLVEKGEHVALCSSLASGEERFLDYVAYQISSNKAYEVILVSNALITAREVIAKVQMSKTTAVVVFPYVHSDTSHSEEILKQLYRTFKNGEFVAIIKLPWSFYSQPQEFRALAPFLTNILVRQPLTLEETRENINVRQSLHAWQFPLTQATEVFQLSGGLIRVIKRILKFYELAQSLDIDDLLAYPALTVVMAELAEMYAALAKAKLQELGIVDKDGNVIGLLLRKYLAKQNIAPKRTLSEKMRQLFNLFYANRNKLVTEEMIDQIVRKGKSGSLWANYKLVARLRGEIGSEYTLRTIKGKGYVLSEKA
jgi:hypothetical protein